MSIDVDAGPRGGKLRPNELEQSTDPVATFASTRVPIAVAETAVIDPGFAGRQQDVAKSGCC
jgi:hypothetical protein